MNTPLETLRWKMVRETEVFLEQRLHEPRDATDLIRRDYRDHARHTDEPSRLSRQLATQETPVPLLPVPAH
jgi:hypothetical protein